MSIPEDQIAELKSISPDVSKIEEGGVTYFLIPGLRLPEGCTPQKSDVLLCPSPRDGYSSRLFFAEHIESRQKRNWQASVRIAERNWQVYSWKTPANLRLIQMVSIHLGALK